MDGFFPLSGEKRSANKDLCHEHQLGFIQLSLNHSRKCDCIFSLLEGFPTFTVGIILSGRTNWEMRDYINYLPKAENLFTQANVSCQMKVLNIT